uniref:Prefoldin subunit 4 n=1 Tax=Pseudodiaptomus poplesia TaxID=213370 RepID=A0A1S6GL38_9MAXI|nr:putative prefoldin subunit 4 [Pseudodiaptomus poplesia]
MTGEPDKDVHISLEDQQKINKFARLNQQPEDIKDEIKSGKSEMQTLKDAVNDVEEFQLTCEDGEQIPYQIGEIFLMEDPEAVISLVKEKQIEIEAQSKLLDEKSLSIKGVMSDLKTHLYAKFGDSINLDDTDE